MSWLRENVLVLHAGLVFAFLLILGTGSFEVYAAEDQNGPAASEDVEERSPIESAARMFAAALTLGVAALATSMAQARIGSAGVGALAENPKLFGNILIFLVVPETIVILGFVIAALMIF